MIHSGFHILSDAGKYLDALETAFARQAYHLTGCPIASALPRVLEPFGAVTRRGDGQYLDSITMPYPQKSGKEWLTIVRPILNTKNLSFRGHMFIYEGNPDAGLEGRVKTFIHEAHLLERDYCRDCLLSKVRVYGGIPVENLVDVFRYDPHLNDAMLRAVPGSEMVH